MPNAAPSPRTNMRHPRTMLLACRRLAVSATIARRRPDLDLLQRRIEDVPNMLVLGVLAIRSQHDLRDLSGLGTQPSELPNALGQIIEAGAYQLRIRGKRDTRTHRSNDSNDSRLGRSIGLGLGIHGLYLS